MNENGLNMKLVEAWREAALDLGIRVTAPVELRDASGAPFVCEAFVADFGSPSGGVEVSGRTERRVRPAIRSLGGALWVCIAPDRRQRPYVRKHFIDELLDWGWFGPAGEEPDWYRERGGPPAPSPAPGSRRL